MLGLPKSVKKAALDQVFIVFVVTITPGSTALLDFSMFLGGTGTDSATATVFSDGYLYVAGYTNSVDFPTGQSELGAGSNAFVCRLDDTGAVKFCRTFGGNKQDSATAVATDSLGNVYVVGSTNSTDFPTTQGATQTTLQGGYDCFIAIYSDTGCCYLNAKPN